MPGSKSQFNTKTSWWQKRKEMALEKQHLTSKLIKHAAWVSERRCEAHGDHRKAFAQNCKGVSAMPSILIPTASSHCSALWLGTQKRHLVIQVTDSLQSLLLENPSSAVGTKVLNRVQKNPK